MRDFTLEDAKRIQDSHLAEWKTVLKEDVYQKLETIVKNIDKKNEELISKNPYSVCRGSSISCIVSNLAMGNYEMYKDYL